MDTYSLCERMRSNVKGHTEFHGDSAILVASNGGREWEKTLTGFSTLFQT